MPVNRRGANPSAVAAHERSGSVVESLSFMKGLSIRQPRVAIWSGADRGNRASERKYSMISSRPEPSCSIGPRSGPMTSVR